MRRGRMSSMAFRTAGSQPLRGGSTTRTSAFSPLACQRGNTSSARPAVNSTLRMPFSSALRRASSTASGTISTPYTLRARRARNREIVPMPQYTSMTVSSPVSPAYCAALRYSVTSAPYSLGKTTGVKWRTI